MLDLPKLFVYTKFEIILFLKVFKKIQLKNNISIYLRGYKSTLRAISIFLLMVLYY